MSEALKLAEAFKLVEIADIDLDEVCKNNRWGIDAAEMLKDQAAEIDSLRAEVAALKADAERLDYLDSLATYESRVFMGGTHQLIFSHDFVDEPNANFRAAIDAAILKERG